MSKKRDNETVNVTDALKIIQGAQKRSKNKEYQDYLFSEESKKELGNSILNILKYIMSAGALFLAFIVVVWIVAIVCVAYKGHENSENILWLINKIENVFAQVVPPIVTFIFGQIYGKAK